MLTYLVPSRILSVGLLALAALFAAPKADAQLLRSEERFAYTYSNGFKIGNNVWGTNPGPQQLWVYAHNNWGVKAYHPNSGIKSYPNVERYVNKRISALTKLESSFTAVTPSGGAWSVTYDIWDAAEGEEIMLWFNYTGNPNGSGNVRPISASYNADGSSKIATGNDGRPLSNVTIGGHTWNIYKGKNQGDNVYSFLRTGKTNSAWVDIRAILNFLRTDSRTRWIGDFTVGKVQHGFEISTCGSSSSNRAEFKFTSYNLWQ